MTIDINDLRRKVNSTDIVDHIDLHANINPILSELIDRIEAAEKERDALRTKVDAMERQEPVAWFSKRYGFVYMSRHPSQLERGSILYLRNGAPAWRIEGSSKVALLDIASIPHGTVFYALIGAKGE